MIKLVTCCPSCGHQLGRSSEGTQTETVCSKCGAVLNYMVSNTTVTVQVVKPSTKLKKAQ